MGYVENGFIVDVTHAKKTSEIIYELSTVLDLPEAKDKNVCVKFGDADLTRTQLISIKAMVESMGSTLSCVTSNSKITIEAAQNIGLEVTNIENKVPLVEFDEEKDEEVNKDLEVALGKIFGDEQPKTSDIKESIENPQKPVEIENNDEYVEKEDSVMVSDKIQYVDDYVDTEEVLAHLKETEMLPTLYIQRTLRSGQSISSDGNMVIIGDVNPGSEIIAKGDITVWGILGGIAHAGSEGNSYARIRALKMNAIQLRIGETFARRPDTVNIPYVQKSDSYTPEEACIRNSQIILHKIHEA